MTTTRAAIVGEARRWRGTPWRHLGRTDTGLDCVGLLIVVARAICPLAHEGPPAYPRRPDGTFLDHFAAAFDGIPMADAVPGDILVFAEGVHPCHCGIRTTLRGAPAVVHAHARRRIVLEEPIDQARSVIGRPIHAFRFRGVGH